ncbi:MAG: class I SAM-dependent methyltransferase [Gammaproteobacteria bacterium]|nr:class I SAM-dependent methyltransferase [Gammaproteobacteria bacterium]MDH3432037.1 class I SAM-dependent methyltransferase [Gammaproteobacteria bacterium]MDH3433092.1 class I SAM-dependent methyltransferase [Gammaproteobacteria bacterium]
MSRSSRFWDRVADRYAKKPVPDEAVYQKKLAITREYLQPHMEVLEIGCGTGSTALAHAACVRHIHATDISAKMIAIAQAKAAAQGIENVTFEQAAVDELSVPEESLDVVLGLSVLHLLENKEDAIADVHRMLKPGGIFVTSTVCLGDTMKFFKAILPIGRFLRLIPLVRVFSTQELADSLTNAGFDIDFQWQPGKGEAVFIVAKRND